MLLRNATAWARVGALQAYGLAPSPAHWWQQSCHQCSAVCLAMGQGRKAAKTWPILWPLCVLKIAAKGRNPPAKGRQARRVRPSPQPPAFKAAAFVRPYGLRMRQHLARPRPHCFDYGRSASAAAIKLRNGAMAIAQVGGAPQGRPLRGFVAVGSAQGAAGGLRPPSPALRPPGPMLRSVPRPLR